MTKSVLYALVAIVLAAAGIVLVSKNTRYVRTQVAAIQAQDATADPLAAVMVLKSYVSNHMGTSANFVLTGSYNRALAASQAAQAAAAANANVYAAAQAACSGKTDSITQAKCNANYLATHTQNVPAAAPVTTPQLADYTFHLRAPVWTPDLAGALFLGALASAGLFGHQALKSQRRRQW